MRILLTGVAGFIGSNLSRRLLEEGHDVIGIDDLSFGVRENLDPRIQFFQEDIRSQSIHRLFKDIDCVFHFAAKNCLPDCLKDPVATADINVTGTANVLQAASSAGVHKFVFADTSAEYEGIEEFPSKPDRIAPLSVYARSKRSGAMFCEAYQQFFGLRLTMLRYFNVYGPMQDWRRSIPPVMSAFIMKLLQGERPIIYGDGEKRRDFVYIDDVTDFNLLAMTDSKTDGRIFNVGCGSNYSINEIFRCVQKILGTNIQPEYKAELPGEAHTTLADITAELQMGWSPKISLDEGIIRSISYIQKFVLA